jgi:hypothetical protein
MADISRIDMKDVYLYIQSRQAADDDISTILFKFAEGKFNTKVAKGFEFIPNRGIVATGTVKEKDQIPCDISFSGEYDRVFIPAGSDADVLTPYEMLMGMGRAEKIVDPDTGDIIQAGWVGLGTSGCEPYATRLMLVVDPALRLPGCASGEVLMYLPFFCEEADFDVSGGTLDFKGKCKTVGPSKYVPATHGALPVLHTNTVGAELGG